MGLERIIQSMLFRGEASRVDDTADVQTVQTSGFDGYIDEAEHVQPYGFRSRAKPGAQTIVARLGAVGALVAWVFDGRYRLTLEEGEVAILDDQGQKVHLKRAGIEITDKNGQSVKMTSAGVEVLSDAVRLGNSASDALVKRDSLKTYLTMLNIAITAATVGDVPLTIALPSLPSDVSLGTTKVTAK